MSENVAVGPKGWLYDQTQARTKLSLIDHPVMTYGRHLFSLLLLYGTLFIATGIATMSAQIHVESRTPDPNDINVDPHSSITLAFSEALDVESVDATSIRINGSHSGPLSFRGNFSVEAGRVVWTPPSTGYAPGEIVTVTVTDQIDAINSQSGSTGTTFQFVVAAKPGSGAFVASEVTLGDDSSMDVALGDLDGDGDLDAVIANRFGTTTTLWINEGGGNFTEQGDRPFGDAYSVGITLGDLDNDGDLDGIVVHDDGPNTVWLNDGGAVFSQKVGSSLGKLDDETVALGDLDSDGDLDAVIARIDDTTTVWLNDGSGIFTQKQETSLGVDRSSDIDLGDLDGDGDLDVVVANIGVGFSGSINTAWTNDGSGNFTRVETVIAGGNSFGIALGDLDGDGDLDAVVANAGDSRSAVVFNDGTGQFSLRHGNNLGVGSGSAIDLGDFDGDGDLDVILAKYNRDQTIWTNDGSGNFTWKQEASPETGRVSRFALGDVDGDGDLDVVMAREGLNNAIWLNNPPPPPLLLVSSDPDNNLVDVHPRSPISLIFSDTIDPESVNDANIQIRGSLAGTLSGTFRVEGNSVTWTPSALGYAPGELVTVTARRELSSPGGSNLATPITRQFVAATKAGPVTFVEQPDALPNGAGSNAIVLGDLDGDGDLDAIVADEGQDTNSIWLNNGRGSFTRQIWSSLGSGPGYDAALGDLDGDGDLDAIMTNSGDTSVVWLNYGEGAFRPAVDGSLGEVHGTHVSLGDLDGDGDLDAIFSSNESGNTVWLNNSLGTFTLYDDKSLGSARSNGVALGDLDGDGDLDGIVIDLNGANSVWLNDGSGQLTQREEASLGEGTTYAVALGDLDGDDDLDGVVANDNTPNTVWLNDGTGLFTQKQGTSLDLTTSRDVSLGDIDGDGDLDAVIVNDDSDGTVWINDGSGSFSQAVDVRLGTRLSRSLALGDLDGDADLDVVTASSAESPGVIWLNSSPLTAPFLVSSDPAKNQLDVDPLSPITLTFIEEIDDSGANDASISIYGSHSGPLSSRGAYTVDGRTVVWSPPAGGYFPGEIVTVVILHSISTTSGIHPTEPIILQFVVATEGDRQIQFSLNTEAGFGYDESATIALGDIDNDGDLDGVVENVGSTLQVVINDGTGNFTPKEEDSLGERGERKISLGDLDSDGDLDAVVATPGPFNTVWINDGTGSFVQKENAGIESENSFAVALGDLDGDSDLDAAVANAGASTSGALNTVWINDGTGSFTRREWTSLGGERSYGLALGDLDRDGDLDAVVANWVDRPNEIWLNNGEGFFTQKEGTSIGNGNSRSVVLGDLDADGDLDAIAVNYDEIDFAWLNDGTGDFAAIRSPFFENGPSRDIALGDLDGDGDLDAVVSTNSGETNSIWVNNGNGEFKLASSGPPGSRSTDGVALGDLDGDGDLDAVLASLYRSQNEVWVNAASPAGAIPSTSSGDIFGSFRFVPHPATVRSSIQLDIPAARQVIVEIDDALGRSVLVEITRISDDGWLQFSDIDMTALQSSGFYILRVRAGAHLYQSVFLFESEKQ